MTVKSTLVAKDILPTAVDVFFRNETTPLLVNPTISILPSPSKSAALKEYVTLL